ncbi:MAG: VWA domain-containing protein [Deltaproteobacteria bacterium]|nr:VWA domain-containing protein [Deltaproteobacteria bacterium]
MRRTTIVAFALMMAVTAAAAWIACSATGMYAPSMAGLRADGRAGGRGIEFGVAPLGCDELWVVARGDRPAATAASDDAPAAPELRAKLPGGSEQIPLPLQHTAVRARIDAYLAAVQVEQLYFNPYAEKIEVVYVFPLPEDAAVSAFVMRIGDRTIQGLVRERAEAERIYAAARQQGFVASLLTEERPNVFTQKVANIEPGRDIEVELTYYNSLPYRDDSYLFSFPTVVGPRFNPAGQSNGIGALARGALGSSGQSTEVSYLASGEDSGARLSLEIDLDAGVAVESLDSPTHAISVQVVDEQRRRIALADGAAIPDRDFVLRYRVAGGVIKSAFLDHRDERGGFFTMVLTPPAAAVAIGRSPVEHVFVLDCSGSMSGVPLDKAKAAVRRVLGKLEPPDTFQIINFSLSASSLGPVPLLADRGNLERGLRYLDRLHGEGGTMMIEGIKAALDFPHQEGHVRLVSFLTDGYIGNEAEILAAIHSKLGRSRIFSFGVGSAVNRYLLEQMARVGQGAVAYVGLGDTRDDERAVDAFYDRIARPALSDIQIDWQGANVSEVFPSRTPDLWSGRPVVISGRYQGPIGERILVRGRIGGQGVVLEVPLARVERSQRPAIAQVWARMKIADLAERSLWEDSGGELSSQIKQVALDYGLLSQYTAFVAVDDSRVTAGDHGTTVAQPVPVPAGVRYETTVLEPRIDGTGAER